jgi:uncharacterized membrane protein YcaP (DUF421 family)
VFIVFAILIFGKKELSQISIIDLVFILLISNSVQNAMINGDWESLWMGIIASSTLFLFNWLFKLLEFDSRFFNRLIEGQPVMLIYEGKVLDKNLTRERITVNELLAAVREHGVAHVSEVSTAVLEMDGNISVVTYTERKQTLFKRKKRIPRMRR